MPENADFRTDYRSTNDPRIRVRRGDADESAAWMDGKVVFWTFCILDADGEDGGEEDLAVERGTPLAAIRSAARYLLERDFTPGCTIARGTMRLA